MIRETLASLTAEENLRTLPEIAPEGIYIEHEGKRYLNLSSNDYLGIACRDMHREFMHEIGESDAFLLSNPSSRLITGNSPELPASNRPFPICTAAKPRWYSAAGTWPTQAYCRR